MEKSTTRSVVKNAACGNNSALAKAVLKDQELKDLILMEMINEIKKEIRLYSKDPACLLKLKSPADIRRFSNESFYQQLLVKCPKLAVLLSCLSQPGNLKGNLPDFKEAEIINQFRNSVCMAASICLHQYNQQMSAAHYRISLLLLNGGAKALTLQRCAGLGISVSHSSAIRMQTKAAAPNVSKATSWKEDIVSKTLQLNFLERGCHKKKTAQINMSQNEVSSYECFADSVYANSCKLLEIAGEEGCLSYSRNVIISAVENLEKSIVHFK